MPLLGHGCVSFETDPARRTLCTPRRIAGPARCTRCWPEPLPARPGVRTFCLRPASEVFDRQMALEQCLGNEELLRKMAVRFVETVPALLETHRAMRWLQRDAPVLRTRSPHTQGRGRKHVCHGTSTAAHSRWKKQDGRSGSTEQPDLIAQLTTEIAAAEQRTFRYSQKSTLEEGRGVS